jgi:arylsulfatase A
MAFRTGFRSVFTGVGGPCLIEAGSPDLAGHAARTGLCHRVVREVACRHDLFDADGKPIRDGGIKACGASIIRGRPRRTAPPWLRPVFRHVSCPTTDWLYAYVEGDRIPVPPAG